MGPGPSLPDGEGSAGERQQAEGVTLLPSPRRGEGRKIKGSADEAVAAKRRELVRVPPGAEGGYRPGHGAPCPERDRRADGLVVRLWQRLGHPPGPPDPLRH